MLDFSKVFEKLGKEFIKACKELEEERSKISEIGEEQKLSDAG